MRGLEVVSAHRHLEAGWWWGYCKRLARKPVLGCFFSNQTTAKLQLNAELLYRRESIQGFAMDVQLDSN